nr:MAG TPA: minor capsid protein [Microviridae sp.]
MSLKTFEKYANSALKASKEMASYNNKLDQSNVKLQYEYNKSLADQDRAFQERMSNSAHQREVTDLKAAGLNPVLSVSGGAGASTPSGSATSVSKPNVDTSVTGAIMDWAVAQLNSATSLQRTAMETSSALALENIRQQQENYRHLTPGGSTIYGQVASVFDDLLGLFGKKGVTGRGSGRTTPFFAGLPTLISNSFNSLKRNSKIKSPKAYAASRSTSTDIDRLISGLRQGKTGRSLSKYSTVKNSSYRAPVSYDIAAKRSVFESKVRSKSKKKSKKK